MFVLALVTTPAGSLTPPDSNFPIFAVLLVLESIAFGAGVAYLLRARRTLFGAATPALERAVAWSVAYLLLAPWPHDELHRLTYTNGVFNWPALAGVEYVFHLGVVPVGLIVGAYLLRARKTRQAL
jgi:hypothetical protein